MMNLLNSPTASPLLHTVPKDPGTKWIKDTAIVVEAPPDNDLDPLPEATWPADEVRTGKCGAVSPRVVVLPDGRYRIYYTQILPRPGFPAGANDYDNATTRILSVISEDGTTWTPEPGVRLSAEDGGAGDFRVVSSEVVPLSDDSGRMRMYFESCPGSQKETDATIRSAISEDGLEWTLEPGVRFGGVGRYISTPRIIFLYDGRTRLYCGDGEKGIISAVSEDGGTTFREESGVRMRRGEWYDEQSAFAPEIVKIEGGGYRMYYAGYSTARRSDIVTALSDDGLAWRKEKEPVVSPGPGGWDGVKCSEMSILPLPVRGDEEPGYRMVYEACDGKGPDNRGVWRIAGVTNNHES